MNIIENKEGKFKLSDNGIFLLKQPDPNDIYIKKQKICGILQEILFRNKKKYMVVGIGINLNKSPKIENYSTNFINFFTKKNVKRLQLFRILCNSYEKKINQFN